MEWGYPEKNIFCFRDDRRWIDFPFTRAARSMLSSSSCVASVSEKCAGNRYRTVGETS